MNSFYDECVRGNRFDLLRQWDTDGNLSLTPKTLFDLESADVWWMCEKGHRWQSKVSAAFCNSIVCPICVGNKEVQPVAAKQSKQLTKKIVSGKNDLESVFPKIAAEWDYKKNYPLKPSEVAAYANKKVWWICEKGHEYETFISVRTSKKSGCPYCAGKRTLSGFNDLKSKNPEIAKEWNYERNGSLKPEEVQSGSSKKVWWKCEKGHEWKAIISSRTKCNNGCPICKGRVVLAGFNDLKTTEPKIAKEWCMELNGELTPLTVTRASNKKVWWKCSCGHIWMATVGSRTVKQTGCPVCGGNSSHSTLYEKQDNDICKLI